MKARAEKMDVEGPPGTSKTISQGVRYFVTATLTRPVHLLSTELTVIFLSLYAAFDVGLLYMLAVASPATFSGLYGSDVDD